MLTRLNDVGICDDIIQITKLLLRAKCDHTIADNDGRTADDYAGEHGVLTLLQLKAQKILV